MEDTSNKPQEINLNEITPQQALQFVTNTVRQLPLTYVDHVNLEQCRQVVQQAIS